MHLPKTWLRGTKFTTHDRFSISRISQPYFLNSAGYIDLLAADSSLNQFVGIAITLRLHVMVTIMGIMLGVGEGK